MIILLIYKQHEIPFLLLLEHNDFINVKLLSNADRINNAAHI